MQWTTHPALGVVLAAKGYPGNYEKGQQISGLEAAIDADVKIFHAGTKLENNKIITTGGRVLCVCALGDHIATAQQKAYTAIKNIHWEGMFYRKDIGHRAIRRYIHDEFK